MLRIAKQHPFPSPMAALDFIEELAREPTATALIKEVVGSEKWRVLRTIGRKGSGEIRIERNVPKSGAVSYGEGFIATVDTDFQLVWAVRLDRALLRLEIISEEKDDRLWESRCAVCLHWEEDAPTDLLLIQEWIDRKRILAHIRDGAQDLQRSLNMRD